jgi:hypothetical protein
MRKKFHRLPKGKGAAIEVYGSGTRKTATRYRFEPKPVMHHGKLMHERLGFRGHKVVEAAFVPIKRKK